MQGKHTCPCQPGSHLQTASCVPRMCFPSTPGAGMEGLLLSQHQGLFSTLPGEESRKFRRGSSKGFASRLTIIELLEQEEGRECSWPEPGACGCPLPIPCPQAVASPGHGCWQHPLQPSQKVSVPLSAGWRAAQNRKRAPLGIALLKTKGINNPAGEMGALPRRGCQEHKLPSCKRKASFP